MLPVTVTVTATVVAAATEIRVNYPIIIMSIYHSATLFFGFITVHFPATDDFTPFSVPNKMLKEKQISHSFHIITLIKGAPWRRGCWVSLIL